MGNSFTIDAVVAKQALNHITKGQGTKTTLPSLNQIRIQPASDDLLAMTSNRIDRQITAMVSGRRSWSDGPDFVDVPIAQLKAALDLPIGKLRDQTVMVYYGDPDAPTIVHIGTRQVEKVNDLEPLPVWDEEDTTELGLIEQHDSRGDFHKLFDAAASNDGRPVLAGINVRPDPHKEGRMMLEAADGFRMATYLSEKMVTPSDDFIPLLFPAEAFKSIPKNQTSFRVHAQKDARERGWLTYQLNANVFIMYGARLIEGQYPDLSSIVPNYSGQRVRLKADDIAAADTYSRKYAPDEKGTIRIRHDELRVVSKDNGDLVINGYQNAVMKDDTLGLNGEYMVWAASGHDELEFNYNTVNAAVVSYQGPLTIVIMPMVIGEN